LPKRLRELAKGLTDADDIAAVNKYVDELEKIAEAQRSRSKEDDNPVQGGTGTQF
jgi:hypothetical protein